jgi:hypothetical protein
MKVDRIHLILFLGAFVVGCIVVYYTPIEYKTVLVYPTPANAKRIQYKDDLGSCYRFSAKEVKCGSNPKEIPAPYSSEKI